MFRRLPIGPELSQKVDGTGSAHMELGTLQAENGQRAHVTLISTSFARGHSEQPPLQPQQRQLRPRQLPLHYQVLSFQENKVLNKSSNKSV